MKTGALPARKVLSVFLALSFFLFAFQLADAKGQVDLRGKKGVVDPKDLKKYDPPPKSLKIKEPPPPQPRKAPGGDTPPKNPPSDQGSDPSKRRVPVRAQPHPDWKPPAPTLAPKPGLVR
jgi:hypothetical protein